MPFDLIIGEQKVKLQGEAENYDGSPGTWQSAKPRAPGLIESLQRAMIPGQRIPEDSLPAWSTMADCWWEGLFSPVILPGVWRPHSPRQVPSGARSARSRQSQPARFSVAPFINTDPD